MVPSSSCDIVVPGDRDEARDFDPFAVLGLPSAHASTLQVNVDDVHPLLIPSIPLMSLTGNTPSSTKVARKILGGRGHRGGCF